MKNIILVLLLSCTTNIALAHTGKICVIETPCIKSNYAFQRSYGILQLSIGDKSIYSEDFDDSRYDECNVLSDGFNTALRNVRKMARDLKAAKYCDIVIDKVF